MWLPLSKVLEVLGRVRLPTGVPRPGLAVGEPTAKDALGGDEWKRYLDVETLYDVWGPVKGGAWEPFHAIPLFAAIGRIPKERLGPMPDVELPVHMAGTTPPPAWAGPGVCAFVDLPGSRAVSTGLWLAASAGYQPVCTFNNWPHTVGLVRSETVLAALLEYASSMARAREKLTPASPPVWLCDRRRLGERAGNPHEFDNRYYLEETVLPGPGLLKAQGIRKVVYLVPGELDRELDDLCGYFAELQKEGFELVVAATSSREAVDAPKILEPRAQEAMAHMARRLTYRRSGAGGFGALVPVPSSGG